MSRRLKGLLFIGASVLAGLSLSAGTSKASQVVNQHRNALTSYISSSNFHFIHNHDYAEPKSYNGNYNQNVDPTRTLHYVGGNDRVNYHAYAQLEDQDGNYNPQSVVIAKNGTTYVSYNLGNNDVQIARYPNINDVNDLTLQNVHYGPVFKGGHAQAMAYNPKNDQLWLLYNPNGSANYTKLFEINKSSLKPIRTIKFHMSPYPMGDVLAFDKNGNAYTSIRTFGGAAPVGSLKLFKGKITNHSVNFHMVQSLRYAPGTIMQNMSYNLANNRVYFITNDELMSVPANRYNHLKPSDVKVTKLSGRYEFEDLAFYHGKGYLMVHYPSELLVSDNHVSSKSNRKSAKRTVKRHHGRVSKRHAKKQSRKSNHRTRKSRKVIRRQGHKRVRRHGKK